MIVSRTLLGNHAFGAPPYWVDLGIDVEPGTTITVSATGTVQWSGTNSCGPNGDPSYPFPNGYPAAGTAIAPSARPFSLVIQMGAMADPGANYGGAWTNPPTIPAVGSATVGNGTVRQGGVGPFSFSSGPGGKLWAAFNDLTNAFNDNTGSFTLTIDYTPRASTGMVYNTSSVRLPKSADYVR